MGRTEEMEEQEWLHTQWKTHHVTETYKTALEKMASTTTIVSLWTSDDVDIVLFREYAQTAILPVMNSTHRVEFGVREASLCAMKLRHEGGRSAYAFIRSCVGKRTNYNVNVEMKANEQRRNNQHVEAGAKGQRSLKSRVDKRKHDGDNEKEKDADIIERTARGTVRSKHMLTTVNEMLQELKSITGYMESRKRNRESFRNYFADKRLESALEKFSEKKDTIRRRQTEPETGVDVTAQSMRMLQLSKLRAGSHFDALKAECQIRGVTVGTNFSSTRKALMDWLKRTPVDDDGNARPSELIDGKYMTPLSPELQAVLEELSNNNSV
jgi:hypothetical protein